MGYSPKTATKAEPYPFDLLLHSVPLLANGLEMTVQELKEIEIERDPASLNG
ncbi:MAG: hypothetical protein GY820_48105 [Gammaproteobacteria bacterium]|nr:hypothetical protein [Gammaproteobacteria bacterium]